MNKLTASPFRIDSPSTSPLYTAQLEIQYIDFAGYVSSAQGVEVQDKFGNTICFLRGLVSTETIRSARIGIVQGLMVPLLDSFGNPNLQGGMILVYY